MGGGGAGEVLIWVVGSVSNMDCALPSWEWVFTVIPAYICDEHCPFFLTRPWYRALVFLLTHSSWRVRQSAQSCIQHLFNNLGESAVDLQSSLLAEFSKLLFKCKVSKSKHTQTLLVAVLFFQWKFPKMN